MNPPEPQPIPMARNGGRRHTRRIRNTPAGFSLIELLTVTAIIAILVGMIGSAAFAARHSAYRAKAQAEVRELANAMKSYWLAFGEWPEGVVPGGPNNAIAIGRHNLAGLRGNNPRNIVFLELSDHQFGMANDGRTDMFIDPWGNPYEMFFADAELERTSFYRTTVAPPMANRYRHHPLAP